MFAVPLPNVGNNVFRGSARREQLPDAHLFQFLYVSFRNNSTSKEKYVCQFFFSKEL